MLWLLLVVHFVKPFADTKIISVSSDPIEKKIILSIFGHECIFNYLLFNLIIWRYVFSLTTAIEPPIHNIPVLSNVAESG